MLKGLRFGGTNNKGQSTQFIILLLVGAAAAVLVILGLNGFFTKLGDTSGALPGSLTVAGQSCEFSAQQGDKTGYCSDFKEVRIGNKKQWINCAYLKDAYDTDFGNNVPSCSENIRGIFCDNLMRSDPDEQDTIVNGEPCYLGDDFEED